MAEYTIRELNQLGVVKGLEWFNEDLCRFPLNAREKLDPNLWEQARAPSGVRLHFKTRCDIIVIDVTFTNDDVQDILSNLERGIDILEDGMLVKTIVRPPGGGQVFGFVECDGKNTSEYTIFFPYCEPVKFNALALEFKKGDDEPVIEPANDSFNRDEPLIFYGSSITHGFHAQRPSITYPALIARRLNLDFINLGFGGAGKGEPEVAELLASIKNPLLYILDWGINIWSDEEKDLIYPRYGALIQKIKEKHPETPILLVNLQTGGEKGINGEHMRENIEEIRREIKRVHEQEVKNGNSSIFYADAMEIINQENVTELTTDRIHPNQAGAMKYADVLAPIIKKILKL
ncbi:MAG: SGNH/GDSL hydrolase family protein [Promethearchaeota archaeon]